jgi:hypothetical protein
MSGEGWNPGKEIDARVEKLLNPDVDFDRVVIVNGKPVTVREYNETHSMKINGSICPFCGRLKYLGSEGFTCFACNPEEQKRKMMKEIRKQVKMVVEIT